MRRVQEKREAVQIKLRKRKWMDHSLRKDYSATENRLWSGTPKDKVKEGGREGDGQERQRS